MRYFLLLLTCAIFSSNVLAANLKKSFANSSGALALIKASNNQVGYQSVSTNVSYTEVGNGVQTTAGTLDTESGAVPGQAFYFYAMNDNFLGNDYYKATYDQSVGYTNYIGANLNLPNGPAGPYGSVTSTTSATLTNYSFRYGKGFSIQGISMLTPYLEIGSHKWDRGVNYGETYSHNYIGYGFLDQYTLPHNVVLSIDAMLAHTNGSAIVVTSSPPGVPVASQVTGFSTALGDSTMYRIGVSLDFVFGPRIHLNSGLDYSAFNYGISATQPSGLLEPDSRTNYTTFRLGVGLGF